MNYLIRTILLLTVITTLCPAQSPPYDVSIETEAITKVMQAVADWQIANPYKKRNMTDWTHGALFTGLVAWAEMAPTDKYFEVCLQYSRNNQWKLGPRFFHADDHAVAQMYLQLYDKYRDLEMIAPLIKQFDQILANPPQTPLTHDNKEHKKRYNWCDALFMAPPVWVRLASLTGNQAYLDYANKEWWATTDYLYDTEEHLYTRDDTYFKKREANGKKIFWSRGNGWVYGGLVRVLANLPKDHPDYPRYITVYKEMSAKLISLQGEDGLWRASLLCPETYPAKETSGTGFYCYGLAWGINRGLLDVSTYLPAVKKAWQGLVECVHEDGKLGWVQRIGAAPDSVSANDTQVYGVGAFLLAGSEVYKIALRGQAHPQTITAINPLTLFRDQETVSIPEMPEGTLSILDYKTNRLLTTQRTHRGELLFQVDFAPGEKRFFGLLTNTDLPQPQTDFTTFGRFVPERKDDFAWENDRIAYRMYGPALEDETITCGIDPWVKRVPYPIIDKWYAGGDYHRDHGEGADFYKVGPTLGCGGMAPYVDGKIQLPRNFTTSKVLDNGPIRTTFELTYASWKAGDIEVKETKRISLDLGQNLNRIECQYQSSANSLPLAAGIVKRKGGHLALDLDGSWLVYQEPTHAKNGTTSCALIMGHSTTPAVTEKHFLLTFTTNPSAPVVYYTGACWDKSGQFKTETAWQQYIQDMAKRINHPIRIMMD